MESNRRVRFAVLDARVAGIFVAARTRFRGGGSGGDESDGGEQARSGAALRDVPQRQRAGDTADAGAGRAQGDGWAGGIARGNDRTSEMERLWFRRSPIQECEHAGGLRRGQGEICRASGKVSEDYFEFKN